MILIVALALVGCSQQKEHQNSSKNTGPHLKISVLQSGRILIDGKESSIDQVEKGLVKLKSEGGSVWYYREAGQKEPPTEAMEIIKLVVENKLPITLSSKPDFSDYIDENGQSHPRE